MSRTFKDIIRIETLRLAAMVTAALPIAAFVIGYFVFWEQLSKVSVWLAALLPIAATLLLSYAAYKILTSRLFEPLLDHRSNHMGKKANINEERADKGFKRLFRGRRRYIGR